MCTPPQSDRDTFRVLLYRHDAAELLIEETENGLRLPAVGIPGHSRIAEQITAAIQTSWNLAAYCLFSLPNDSDANPSACYQVAEVCQANAAPPTGMQWLPTNSLREGQFPEPADFAAIRDAQTILDRYRRAELPGAFGKSGWLRDVTEWVGEHTVLAGHRLTGKFRQLNASPTFSLLRFETGGPALWFKAVGESNLHEHRITLKVASLLPEFLPNILASHSDWNAWLAVESDGHQLDADSTDRAWASAAENLALLQIASFGRRFSVIQAGCKDLRPRMLLGLVDPFLGAMAKLMEQQAKVVPTRLSRRELLALGCDLTSALQEVQDSAIPSTLGHLDMNPGNLLVRGRRCVFLDWAEAYVGPPFFSFQYLLENLRRLHGADSHHEKSLVSSYAKHWSCFASPEEIAANLRLVPLLAAFTYAASSMDWRNLAGIQPATAGYLRSLTRRMKREADTLQQRRLTCVR